MTKQAQLVIAAKAGQTSSVLFLSVINPEKTGIRSLSVVIAAKAGIQV
jgi:hypothetical protein